MLCLPLCLKITIIYTIIIGLKINSLNSKININIMTTTRERLRWIDICRSIFMLMILWFHTEIYYFGDLVLPYSMYVENALAGFLFISGYLFIPKIYSTSNKTIIYNIFRRLIIPYIVFSLFLGITKVLFRGESIEFILIIKNILTGNASWFISALIMCQLFLVIMRYICNNRVLLLFACTIPFLYIAFTKNYSNFSIIDGTAISIIFMNFGYIYKINENFFDSINNIFYILIALILILLKIIVLIYKLDMTFYYISIDNYLIFLLDTLLWCIIIVKIVKHIHINNIYISYMEWIGKHTLVFYFLSGGVPLVITTFMHKLFSIHSYYSILLIVFLLVMITITIITYILFNIKFFRNKILYVDIEIIN